MFILTTLKDNVRVSPMDFQFPRPTAVESELNKKYSNRVLHGVGLCVRVFDILSLTDGIVHSCTSGGGSDSSSTSGGAYMTKGVLGGGEDCLVGCAGEK